MYACSCSGSCAIIRSLELLFWVLAQHCGNLTVLSDSHKRRDLDSCCSLNGLMCISIAQLHVDACTVWRSLVCLKNFFEICSRAVVLKCVLHLRWTMLLRSHICRWSMFACSCLSDLLHVRSCWFLLQVKWRCARSSK